MILNRSVALALTFTSAVLAAACGGSTTVVEEPSTPASAVPAPPPGGETEITTEHPDGSETETEIESNVDD